MIETPAMTHAGGPIVPLAERSGKPKGISV
jgi:hypothetical protein